MNSEPAYLDGEGGVATVIRTDYYLILKLITVTITYTI